LSRVQKKLNKDGYKIVVYDSYRPQKAVNHFIRWANDTNDIKQKAKYYPYEDKSTLFDKGYIAKRSGHTRGSTLDMSIIKVNSNIKPIDYKLRTLKNNQLVMILDDGTEDFGVSFDFFGEPSHPDSESIDEEFI
jgi:D-alanyl-D-alanine dipeptidase